MLHRLSQWERDFLERHQLPQSYVIDAQKWYSPLAESLAEHRNGAQRPILVAVNGSQGSGKTTLCDYLRAALAAHHGIAALSLSLDDFYLTREQRFELARSVHPLLATRGVPGTHDMPLLQNTLDALLAPGRSNAVAVPRFDKAMDDRCPASAWESVSHPVDIVLLEGWCMGARSRPVEEWAEPVNDLERLEDPDGLWRAYVNTVLAEKFEPLYDRVDQWIMLLAPSFSCVYRWRLEQERKLTKITNPEKSDRSMDATQVGRFIQYFEGLTRHCLEHLPARVQHLFTLDQQRQIIAYSHPVSAAG